MKMRWWHWSLIGLLTFLILAFAGLSYMTGGPRNVYGFLRYGLPTGIAAT
jgi:hypothetical protein